MSRNPIVIVGSVEDDHVVYVQNTLRAQGEEPLVLDASRFPGELTLSLGSSLTDVTIAGVAVGKPRSVYVRSIHADPVGFQTGMDESMERNWRATSMALRERGGVLSALLMRWSACGVPLYNSMESSTAVTKPYQLALLEQHGLPVPKSLWTNDPEQAREFCKAHAAIYKPVLGGAHTKRVREEDLSSERLNRLRSAPVCFQELLPGHDLRVYVLDDKVLCSLKINTSSIDFRDAVDSVEAVCLDPSVERDCIKAARCLGLRFTGMDLKRDALGVPKILELNSSPMFQGFETLGGVSICKPLCQALIQSGSAR